jgi:uncharacterized phage infection (PIP) family protein YhgE
MSIIQSINLWTFLPLAIWAFLAFIWVIRKSTNKLYLQSIPSGFTMAGVLGTFIGITIGLEGFDVADVSGSIPTLLEGLKNAFYTSITGIFLAMVTAKFIELRLLGKDKIADSTETVELKRVADLIQKQLETSEQNIEKLISAFKTTQLNEKLSKIETATSEQAKTLALVPDLMKGHTDQLLKIHENQQTSFKGIIAGNKGSTDQLLKIHKNQQTSFKEIIAVNKDSLDQLKQNAKAITQWPITLQKHQKEETDRIITTLNNNSEELSQRIAEMNSKELLKAMEESVELFNKKMEDILQRLIKKNFEALNNSVHQMNQWQVQNKENMEALIKEQKNLIEKNEKISQQFESTSIVVNENFERTSSEMNTIASQTKKLTDDNSRLQKILKELESITLGDNQFKTIINQAEKTITQANEATEKFSQGMDRVDGLTEDLEKLNGNIYKTQENLVILSKELKEVARLKDLNDKYWTDVKKKMEEGVGILINASERLSDDLDNIDDEFRSRLQQTFESLDRLMRGYLVNN